MATKKVMKPDVVRGGIAIPLKGKTNYYYMSGRKHKNGGIDIGRNPRTGLEVEDGEVMHIADKEIKVFSSVPFLNGKSPAQKVLGGENPDTVFKQQEEFKDRNGINDDGSKKKEDGGKVKNVDYKAIFKRVKSKYDKQNNNTILGERYIARKDNTYVAPSYGKKLIKTKPSKVNQASKVSVSNSKNNTTKNNTTKTQTSVWDDIDKYVSVGEKVLSIADLGLTVAGLLTSNPYILGAGYGSSAIGGGLDIYQGVRSAIKKDWPSVGKNTLELGLSILGSGFLKSARNATIADEALSASRAPREMVTHTVGRGPKNRNKFTITKEAYKANNYYAAAVPVVLTNTMSNTLSDIDDQKEIRERNKYNTRLTRHEENQFQNWYRRVAKHKGLNPDPDAAGQDYDYRGYWKNEDREYILSSDPEAHFSDKYKKPSHSTFSNQSIYSNNITPGGEWVKGKGTWLFKHNNYTARQAKRTNDYLMDTGEGYILGTDTIVPRSKKAIGGLSHSKDYNSSDKKKYKAGGVYSVTVNGETRLKRFPSTGSRTKAALGAKKDNEPKKEKEKIPPFAGKPFEFVKPNLDVQGIKISNLPYLYKDSRTINVIDKNTGDEKEVYNSFYGFSPTDLKPGPLSTIPIKLPSQDISYNYNNKTKFKNYIKEHPNTVSDAIGLASNTIGGLISHNINRHMLDKLDYFPQPMARSATKLKTRININPQLDKMRESLAAYENDINNSTSSSNVALARRQRARFANTLQTNNIYANRENTETELINKDRLNQQSVADANVRDYNTWLQNQTTFRNSLLEKKAENDIGLIETINSGIQNMLTNREKRNTEKQNVAAMSLANPDLPVEVLYEQGLISKRVLDAYRKAYRARKKENNENNKETNNV